MTRQVRSGSGLHKATAAVTTKHSLLTSSWTADVGALETAIGRFTAARPLAGNCQVVLFEIAGDDQLHVNVIHERSRAAVRGWSGPGVQPDGCVYNRRFGDATRDQIIRNIRDMVFA